MGRVQLVTWREARRLERSQAAFAQGTLVGVQATADGRLALVDPGAPTFSRNSVAYKSDGTQVASGHPRFETVNGRTGVLVEEGTQNKLPNPTWASFNGWNMFGLTDTGQTFGVGRILRGSAANGTQRVAAVAPYLPVLPNVPYTLSVLIRKVGLVDRLYLTIEWRDSPGAPILTNSSVDVAPNLTTSFQRFTLTATSPSNAATAFVRPVYDGGQTTNCEIEVALPQLEEHAYATSWTNGTRAAETLTVPTAGVLSGLPSWTIEGWLLFNSLSYNQLGGHNIFWHMGNGGDGFGGEYEIHLARRHNDRKLAFYAPSVLQQASSFIINDGQWYYIAFVYDNGVYRLYANGQKLIEVTGSTIDYAQLGSVLRLNQPYGGGRYFNGLLGPHRISNRARTDQEIAAAYAAGTLEADEYTTFLLPLNGSLAYGRGGYRIAPAIDLTPVGTAWGSRVSWTAQGSGTQVLTSLDGGQSWTAATNGGPVPGISRGLDVTGKVLTVKQRLVAQDMAAAPVMTMSDAVVMAEPQRGADVGRVRLIGSGAGRVRIL